MGTAEEAGVRKEAADSLGRIQEFKVESLVREKELGERLNFREVVPAATRLIDLYRRLAPIALEDFPVEILQQIKAVANQDFNRFNEILAFSPDEGSPQSRRQQLIQGVSDSYTAAFKTIYKPIAYSLHRSADFQRLEREGRATLQAVQDQAGAITGALKKQLEDAARIVDDVRKVAAETGVTQQARYFKEEADSHEATASKWKLMTYKMAWAIGAYAVGSLFVAKIPFLVPTDVFQSVQLAISKVLIFAVLSYVLYLAAKNFVAHSHNAIVNRHRQNALLTYKALVDATKSPEKRETVLSHAAACIFSPQPTGYSSDGHDDGSKAMSVVEVLSKPIVGNGQ
jgi:hypothetical protein